MNPRTTIIIPALNEGAIIGEVVRRLRTCHALIAAGITDILVVDNGSDDDTGERAREAGARVVCELRRGYGRACLAGVRAASDADIIVQMDGDGSDQPEDILRVWEPVRFGQVDLAMGSRTRGHAESGALGWHQRWGNAVGAAYLKRFYGVGVSDLGPLRAFRRAAVLRMQMHEMTYGWSTEMLAKAGRLGVRVAEVPVDYGRRIGGTSKVAGTLRGSLKASWRILRTLGTYRQWQPERGALFVVARLPVPGQTKTRLGRAIGHDHATNLYRAFLHDLGTRLNAAATDNGFDLWWYYAAPEDATEADFAAVVPPGGRFMRQGMGELGPRLWQGFQELRAQGYERIVVISSDSPHLPATWIAQAFDALGSDDVVLGRAADGGYYLLGQHGAPVDLFSGITMSTAEVAAQTVALAATHGLSLAELPITFDIDEATDLAQLTDLLRAQPHLAPATLAALGNLRLAEATHGAE